MCSSNRGGGGGEFLSEKDQSSLNRPFINWSLYPYTAFEVGDKDSQIPVLIKSIPTVCIIEIWLIEKNWIMELQKLILG